MAINHDHAAHDQAKYVKYVRLRCRIRNKLKQTLFKPKDQVVLSVFALN